LVCASLAAKDDTPSGVLSWPHETGLQVSVFFVSFFCALALDVLAVVHE